MRVSGSEKGRGREYCGDNLHRLDALTRLPLDAFQGLAATSGRAWLGEGLLGLYAISSRSNEVVARIRLGSPQARLVPDRLSLAGQSLLVIGTWADDGALRPGNGLARVDLERRRVQAITTLPPVPLTSVYGHGALWIGQPGRRGLDRIEARSGRVLVHYSIRPVGTTLTVGAPPLR